MTKRPVLLVGDRVNRLTVLRISHRMKTFKTGLVRKLKVVQAACTCGRKKWFRSEHVVAGRSKSCGCLNYEPRCSDPHTRVARRVFATLRRSARQRDLHITLTIGHVVSLIFKNCFYCGSPPSRIVEADRPYAGSSPMSNGVDRIDSKKGYLRSNVVSCCFKCNMMKWDLTTSDFTSHLEVLSRRLPTIKRNLKEIGHGI